MKIEIVLYLHTINSYISTVLDSLFIQVMLKKSSGAFETHCITTVIYLLVFL